ncbi:helix-turn-helix domain-containing protein [Novosphingobium umbonatum]|uniref:Helix-turn-helix domain-containing protein n=1 Tax=Novosphingobium umbonatum TaxID=1908524 RepID=A0A437N6C5_9SPHN|nr:helix-turn-helix domain-containing protein [Novosphingobium umbonatum]RVU05474.1 helix-turn-helix domain-containing protein [Novosphingobium umbonatum]
MSAQEQGTSGLPQGVGAKLRAAREAAGLSLGDLAAQSRIRERHLQALEEGDLAALPGRTYALGFAKTFANMVGLDAAAISAETAKELDRLAGAVEAETEAAFAPGDPARVPSSGFAWAAALAVAVAGVGGYVWWQNTSSPAVGLPSLLPSETPSVAPVAAPSAEPSEAPSAEASAQPSGPVVFTAEDDKLWVKFYDGKGQQLLQKLMAKGETYTLPEGVENPQLWTGRPEALSITIGGQAVPKIAEKQKTVKDVPVSAEALLARAATPAPTESASAAATEAAVTKPVVRKPFPRPRRSTAAGDSVPAPQATAASNPSTVSQ